MRERKGKEKEKMKGERGKRKWQREGERGLSLSISLEAAFQLPARCASGTLCHPEKIIVIFAKRSLSCFRPPPGGSQQQIANSFVFAPSARSL